MRFAFTQRQLFAQRHVEILAPGPVDEAARAVTGSSQRLQAKNSERQSSCKPFPGL